MVLYCLLILLLSDLSASNGLPNGISKALAKRQNTTDCISGLEKVCNTDTAQCVADMCQACSGWTIIAECCALSSDTARLQCLQDGLEHPVALTTSVLPEGQSSTAPAQAATGLAACLNWDSMINSCETRTPGLTIAPFRQQASCLCYQQGTYQPSFYDGAFSNCLGYMSTAEPADYASITAGYNGTLDLTPCSHSGGGLSVAQPSSTTSTFYIGRNSTSTNAPSQRHATSTAHGPPNSTAQSASLKLEPACRSSFVWLNLLSVASAVIW